MVIGFAASLYQSLYQGKKLVVIKDGESKS
jgi:hypothetical protein